MKSVGVVMLLMLLWFIFALIVRWHFQFSVRSLLVLAVAVAIPCGWLSSDMKKARKENVAAAAIQELGGEGCHGGKRLPRMCS